MERLTGSDFFSGFLAALMLKGYKSISSRSRRIDKAMGETFGFIEKRARELGIDLRFTIIVDSIHHDSDTVSNGIRMALSSALIDRDRSEIRLALSKERAESILERTPGGKEFFFEIVKEFWPHYLSAA